MPIRALIIDSAPGKSLTKEIDGLLEQGITITINTNRITHKTQILERYGGSINYVNFDITNKNDFIEVVVKNGIGYNILKSRLNVPIDSTIIQAATSTKLQHRLRIIAQSGVGVNHIDCKTATEYGIIVTNTPGCNAISVAEFVIGQMLLLSRNFCIHNYECQHGRWSKDKLNLNYFELKGKTFGIIGVGNIAQQLIPRVQAFGMEVIAIGGKSFNSDIARCLNIRKMNSLVELLKLADIVSLHVPLTTATQNFIDTKELQIMKKGSILINTSRGGIVNETALAQELQRDKSRNVAAAALDTFMHEKSTYKSPLIGIKNVLLTPHIAGTTSEALELASDMIIKNITAILNKNFNIPIVNPEVLERYKSVVY